MKNEPGPIWRANVLGTRHALDAAREAGARRFLHLSSVTVFSFPAFTLSDGVGVTTSEFFGHYGRLLDKRVPVLPTGATKLLATGAAGLARMTGNDTEVNASSAAYLAREGTYSIDKAHSMLGYEPKVDLAEGMGATTQWLRREHL